jgi:hypothetical protein
VIAPGAVLSDAAPFVRPPVDVEIEKIGHGYAVANVEKANEYLLAWDDRGAAWRIAADACMRCLHDEVDPREARAAFEAAARACGKLL